MASAPIEEEHVSGFMTLAGSSAEVSRRLAKLNVEQVVALTLERGDSHLADLVADTVRRIAPLVAATVARRERQTLDKIVDALVPEMPPPQHLLIEARMNAEARTAALETADWLTATQIAEVAGFSRQNTSAQPNKWKREGRIFAIRRGGTDFFPGYALDPSRGYRPADGLAPVIQALPDRDGWELAIWFAGANGMLDGQAPKELLLSEPERVLAAAEDEAAGISHG